MATQYDTWLNTLGTRRADMPMTVRGFAMFHTITYPGDVTDWELSGTVKASPDSTTELATFTVDTPVFLSGKTTWTVNLSGAQTALLPEGLDGRTDLIFDFIISGPSGLNPLPSRLFGGLFPVSGFVTEPA